MRTAGMHAERSGETTPRLGVSHPIAISTPTTHGQKNAFRTGASMSGIVCSGRHSTHRSRSSSQRSHLLCGSAPVEMTCPLFEECGAIIYLRLLPTGIHRFEYCIVLVGNRELLGVSAPRRPSVRADPQGMQPG